MFQGYLTSLESGIEAVGRTGGCQHGHGTLAVTTEEHLQQVCLFRLRGQSRGRSATLHVEHDEGQLHDDGKVHGLTLQTDTGTGSGSHGQCSGKRSTKCRGSTANLILALHRRNAQRLVLGQLVEHVGSGSDGVRTQIELQSGFLGSSNETVCRGLVTRNVHVATGFLVLRLNTIHVDCRGVGVVTIVIACLHHLDIVLCNLRFLGKLLAKEIIDKVQVTVEEPANQSQCKHVTRLQDGLVVHSRVCQTVLHHLCQRTLDDAVGIDAHLAEVVLGLELCFLQVLRTEGVGVNDDGGLGLGVLQLCLQRGSVHSYQHVAQVAWGIDLACANVYLKTRNTRQ